MKRLIITTILAIPGFVGFSQDGTLVEKIRISTVEDLIKYVKRVEKHDSAKYDISRFQNFEKVEVYGITYVSDGLRVKGFLLEPKGDGTYPCIIYNRGGSLDWGSLTHHVASIGLGELARLASKGYVIAASQYRGNGGGEGAEEYGGSDINDVLNLIPLLGSHVKADTSRLGMFGWSRGGMTSFLTLKRTDRFKAVALGCPSTNIVRSIVDRPELDKWWSGFIPNYNNDKLAILKKRSPIYWVEELPKKVPILILQGSSDIAVAPEENIAFVKKLQEHEIPYRFVMFEGGNHSLSTHRDEAFGQIEGWFEKFL